MRGWITTTGFAAAAVATFVTMFAAGACGTRRGADPVPGGGAHEVTSLTIEASPAEGKVGEPVKLTVTAVWAIPYVEDAAAKATYEIVGADMGKMAEPGVFVPSKAGTVRIVAAYEGATASIDLTVKE